jgi:hypothetical protein
MQVCKGKRQQLCCVNERAIGINKRVFEKNRDPEIDF